MKLYIAEKPSLAKAIISVLPKPHKKEDGYFISGSGERVTWCIGHLLELAEPHVYDSQFEKWHLSHLPIIPSEWRSSPKSKTKKQLGIVTKLIKAASTLVHAGDPDREGQLLVDEVINYANVSATKKSSVQRVLISDLNAPAVKAALSQPKSNLDYAALSISALARSRADWLYGINLTRLYTLLGRTKGASQVLSVGRVQTPVLGLIVRRDEEIERFCSKPFYEVLACLTTDTNEGFKAKWQPSEACLPYMDEEKRVVVKALAENVVSRITDQIGIVQKLSKKEKRQSPPLPYNLSALQIDANKMFGLSAKQVLDTCQSLYEKHKLITYPRSDNRYLPEGHFEQRFGVVDAIKNNVDKLSNDSSVADLSIRSACWNDKKVEAHHAIIPTEKKTAVALSSFENNVYYLICRQYLAQFFRPYLFDETVVHVEIAGGIFIAKDKMEKELGFKQLYAKSELTSTTLPNLVEGQALHCHGAELLEKMTSPPEHYTDASLLSAMTGVAKFVTNSHIKAILKETDGLGTEATRAGIIDLLVQRHFVVRKGKQLHSTLLGRALVHSIPDDLSLPDRTALWESNLSRMAKREISYQQFIEELSDELYRLVNSSHSSTMQSFSGLAESSYKRQGQRRSRNRGFKRSKQSKVS
ncbi:DNA topoisomerase III [Pseudoalteromonas xiamenensis]